MVIFPFFFLMGKVVKIHYSKNSGMLPELNGSRIWEPEVGQEPKPNYCKKALILLFGSNPLHQKSVGMDWKLS